ncbi:hypothetical protein [Rhodococcus spelaei]|uniref:hypothetical protein n=1 Tax=Rhodococcus spelaei TaxID=2546320 RepID=UPI0015EF89A6|nr:hypothetical protein [Rhodococcus spelaei]
MKSTPATPGRVLCIGDPDAFVEVARWLAHHGLESTPVPDGDLLGALATEDVLDGLCTSTEATAVQHARMLDIPLVGVRDTGRFALLAGSGPLDKAAERLQFSAQVMSASR